MREERKKKKKKKRKEKKRDAANIGHFALPAALVELFISFYSLDWQVFQLIIFDILGKSEVRALPLGIAGRM